MHSCSLYEMILEPLYDVSLVVMLAHIFVLSSLYQPDCKVGAVSCDYY